MQSFQNVLTLTSTTVLGFLVLNIAPAPAHAIGVGGEVLPPDAVVNGYSLTDAAEAITLWQDTYDPIYLPDFPFQLLSFASFDYTVAPNTYLFLPISSSNNSPPIIGDFPSTLAEAIPYTFGPEQIGGSFQITVDGQTTDIGPAYLTGPFKMALPNGGNTTFTLSAFLTPLAPGTHTVGFQGSLDGQAFRDYWTGLGETCDDPCLSFNFAYNVTAVPEPATMAGLALAGAGLGVLRRKKQKSVE
ncbi:MAG TPA: PEP-CTERM sorting domain-containing protein [Leptolyngbyaceae cyanobacterium M33_DOE_097]|nr:PEP-CTERM sorting domain-containing protein [Leptolyngbyaceae cyanobacterium M33_DOE_097]